MKLVSVTEVTKAVERQLRTHRLLTGVIVERSAQPNEVPGRCPWIGVYRSQVQYPIRALGNAAQSRYQNIDLLLVCQATNGTSGAECEEEVEQLIANVITALFDNECLKPDETSPGIIDTFDRIAVNYRSYDKVDNVYMQTVYLYITAMNRTN